MSSVSDAIHHCSSQHRISKYLAPPIEGQVSGDYGRFFSCTQREVPKKQLSTLLVKRDVPELIAYNQVVLFKTILKGSKPPF